MNIVIMGNSGFPYMKTATTARLNAIAQAIRNDGGQIYFINRLGLINHDHTSVVQPECDYCVIEASGSRFRQSTFWKRSILKIILPALEIRKLIALDKNHGIDSVHVYTQDFYPLIFYYVYTKFARKKLVAHLVELRRSIKGGKSLLKCINDYLVDYFLIKLSSEAYCISNLLCDFAKLNNSAIKTHKVPPICNFDELSLIKPKLSPNPYFLYCGSIAYKDVVDFVVESWLSIAEKLKYELRLVIGGSDHEVDMFRRRFCDNPSILIYNNLEYNELISMYKGAECLLIPLRPIEQDCARFPQKVCEYLASRGVIITTKFGEMQATFTGTNSVIFADAYSVTEYSQKISDVISGKYDIELMRENAYQYGRRIFHNFSYSKLLHRGANN